MLEVLAGTTSRLKVSLLLVHVCVLLVHQLQVVDSVQGKKQRINVGVKATTTTGPLTLLRLSFFRTLSSSPGIGTGRDQILFVGGQRGGR